MQGLRQILSESGVDELGVYFDRIFIKSESS